MSLAGYGWGRSGGREAEGEGRRGVGAGLGLAEADLVAAVRGATRAHALAGCEELPHRGQEAATRPAKRRQYTGSSKSSWPQYVASLNCWSLAAAMAENWRWYSWNEEPPKRTARSIRSAR